MQPSRSDRDLLDQAWKDSPLVEGAVLNESTSGMRYAAALGHTEIAQPRPHSRLHARLPGRLTNGKIQWSLG